MGENQHKTFFSIQINHNKCKKYYLRDEDVGSYFIIIYI